MSKKRPDEAPIVDVIGLPDAPPIDPAGPEVKPEAPPEEKPCVQLHIPPDHPLNALRMERVNRLVKFQRLMKDTEVGELIDLLAGFDCGRLKTVLEWSSSLRQAKGQDRVACCLKLVRVWTDVSPGDHDSELLTALDAAFNDQQRLADLVGVLQDLKIGEPLTTRQLVAAQHTGVWLALEPLLTAIGAL